MSPTPPKDNHTLKTYFCQHCWVFFRCVVRDSKYSLSRCNPWSQEYFVWLLEHNQYPEKHNILEVYNHQVVKFLLNVCSLWGGTNVMAVGEPISVSVYLDAIRCLRSTASKGVSSLRLGMFQKMESSQANILSGILFRKKRIHRIAQVQPTPLN
jgi:hypothetical protein